MEGTNGRPLFNTLVCYSLLVYFNLFLFFLTDNTDFSRYSDKVGYCQQQQHLFRAAILSQLASFLLLFCTYVNMAPLHAIPSIFTCTRFVGCYNLSAGISSGSEWNACSDRDCPGAIWCRQDRHTRLRLRIGRWDIWITIMNTLKTGFPLRPCQLVRDCNNDKPVALKVRAFTFPTTPQRIAPDGPSWNYSALSSGKTQERPGRSSSLKRCLATAGLFRDPVDMLLSRSVAS